MLFHEDFHSTPKALTERLAYIRRNPPRGQAPKWPFVSKYADLQALIHELYVNAKPAPAPSDIEPLRAIKQKVIRKNERVILSRASLDLAIAYRPFMKSAQMRFVEALIDYLRPKAGMTLSS
jgi:hypothetical protein